MDAGLVAGVVRDTNWVPLLAEAEELGDGWVATTPEAGLGDATERVWWVTTRRRAAASGGRLAGDAAATGAGFVGGAPGRGAGLGAAGAAICGTAGPAVSDLVECPGGLTLR